MSIRAGQIAPLIFCVVIGFAADGHAGVLKSLDRELGALVTGTESYLVTVRGDGGWRNLVATGIVFDTAGHIITSAQICEASSFKVTFKDGRCYSALKLGVDNFTGLAVLKIQGHRFSIPAWRTAGPLKSGDWVTLVGNSYDTPSMVNFGSFHGRTEEGFLSLSLNASPGSPGGAVLDIDGDIVGVLVARDGSSRNNSDGSLSLMSTAQSNAQKFLEQINGGSGRSYAVPFEMARWVADQIIQNGIVNRGYLGISTQDIPLDDRVKLGIGSGVMVTDVGEGSPADSAGLQKGDIIISLNSHGVDGRASLYCMVRMHKPEEPVELVILRGGQEMIVGVRLTAAEKESFLGNLGSSQSLDAANDISIKSLNGLESELYRLRKEIDRLRSQLAELKKDQGK